MCVKRNHHLETKMMCSSLNGDLYLTNFKALYQDENVAYA